MVLLSSWPAAPAGFHGKVPARADFIAAGLPPAVLAGWDGWLQQALSASQARLGAAWEACYLAAPLWRFVLSGGVCGPLPLIGVLMPSMDAVGRCFPLMLGRQLDGKADLLALLVGSGAFFAAAEAQALRALEGGFDPLRLGERLPPPPPPRAGCRPGRWRAPGIGCRSPPFRRRRRPWPRWRAPRPRRPMARTGSGAPPARRIWRRGSR
ncbi:type VI secretion system-associated protein TagF [Pseudoroseomonas wenyumeiae]